MSERTVRWWNRLAAWLCDEWLHDLATPAWHSEYLPNEEALWAEARAEQEMVRDLLAEGYSEGWHDAEREWRER